MSWTFQYMYSDISVQDTDNSFPTYFLGCKQHALFAKNSLSLTHLEIPKRRHLIYKMYKDVII